MVRRTILLMPLVAFLSSGASAQQPLTPWVPIPADARFETGDSWIAGGVRYRLYGVQACLRGTVFTNQNGRKRDCGEANLVMLASLVQDLQPVCTPVAQSADGQAKFVTCLATMKRGAAAGSRVDLGTALIASGYGFAALKPDGKPVHMPYFVAELDARKAGAGLWAFADLPRPNAVILKALQQ